MHLKQILKKIAALSPVPLTANEYYDRLTEKVIKKVCNQSSVCIDVGANEGKILAMFIRHCPKAVHYAFEPIPALYFLLKRKYSSAANIFNIAISNTKGKSNFNHVLTNPAYSGLVKRPYDKIETDETIRVETNMLDNVISVDQQITLIKLDIEGGEYNALLGARRIMEKDRPYILFEFGKPGAEAYHVKADDMFLLLEKHQYNISTLPQFLNDKGLLNMAAFEDCFERNRPYFFIAHNKQANGLNTD
jgi:FkbM family methyltransferase